ncbi:MAG: hypothetical protein M3Y42_15090, partial [Actinomycetota bacterium]|nr:hypothetical protein [Actinomycetota bacterium]
HVAYFAFMLAFYDAFFSMVIPLTPKLADAFLGRPLDPSIGMRMTLLGANIGIGDLLIYGLFTVTAYKAYSKIGGWVAIGTVTVFGSIIPACAPLMLAAVIRGGLNVVVPAQTFFGPAALVAYLWLRRRGPERTMAQYLASADVGRELTPLRLRQPVVSPVPAAVTNSARSGGRPVGERV